LSGTGPKAGGPLYLYRLLANRPENALGVTLARQDADYPVDAQLKTVLTQPLEALIAWAEKRPELRAIAQQYGELAGEFEKAYGVTGEADAAVALLASARDTTFSLHMRSWARATTAAGSKAYLYFFSHVPPHPRATALGAFHAGEIPYVFGVVPSSDPREAGFAYTDVDRRLADAMSSYWVSFVKTGDPNGPGRPAWTPYDPADEPYLEFGDTITPGRHLLKAQLDFQERARQRAAARSLP